jgi:hypothetical protein
MCHVSDRPKPGPTPTDRRTDFQNRRFRSSVRCRRSRSGPWSLTLQMGLALAGLFGALGLVLIMTGGGLIWAHTGAHHSTAIEGTVRLFEAQRTVAKTSTTVSMKLSMSCAALNEIVRFDFLGPRRATLSKLYGHLDDDLVRRSAPSTSVRGRPAMASPSCKQIRIPDTVPEAFHPGFARHARSCSDRLNGSSPKDLRSVTKN